MEKQQNQEINHQNNQIYLHLHPFRAVLPYDHKYQTFAKSRWYAKPLLQTLVKQFKAYDFHYYKSAIEQGRITINGKPVTAQYIIKNGDKLIHSAVREEPPILDLDIQIIHDDQDYLVVNKPPSFTVHTGGGFHYNTLSSILQIQKGYKNLFVLHRLDRLTSGLIIYGKSKQKPQIFHKQNQSQQMKKMYYARVTGNFTWQQKILSAEIQCISHKDGIYRVTRELQPKQQQLKNQKDQNEGENINGLQIGDKKEVKESKKKAKQGENPDIKDSKTRFRKVFYDKQTDSSLVECYPISGRTHQIRIHLQFLGFPILNDVVYGGRFVGNNIIKTIKNRKSQFDKGKSSNQICEQQLQQNYGSKKLKRQEHCSKEQNSKAELSNENMENVKGQTENSIYNKQGIEFNEKVKKLRDRIQKQWDIDQKPWQICLHSYQYKLQGKVYQTKKPYWADQSYNFQK